MKQQAGAGRDRWLDRWLPLIAERNAAPDGVRQDILELGCGEGIDSATLAMAGHIVYGIDLSAQAVEKATARVPAARFRCQDIRAPFPLLQCRVVIASLSLHYFTWPETLEIAARIRETLAPEGILLCRLNSVNDVHYGATGHAEIEKNYYRVDGAPKRFFDEADVNRMFSSGWRCLHLQETISHRYDHPKNAWEAVLERTRH